MEGGSKLPVHADAGAGGILLVSCYELGHPPLGIAWPAAFLERAGFGPVLVDVAVDPLEDDTVRRARLVFISTPMHTALALGLRIAERVRSLNPSAEIVFFGHYAVLHRSLLLHRLADRVLGGEVEEAMVAIARCGAKDPTKEPREIVMSRLDFPPPSRDGLPPLGRYSRLVIDGEERWAGAVESSRGCLHACKHCPIPPVYRGRIFVVSADAVLDDVRALVRQGARHVTFADADFLNAPTHSIRIVRQMHEEHPDLTFDFTAKVEHILEHAAMMPELSRRGCLFVVSAIESLSNRVLEILEKGHTREDIDRALRILDGAGLALRPSLLPFTPWSSLDDYIELLAFIEARDLVANVDPVQLTVRLLVPPGSLLENHPAMTPHLRGLDRSGMTWLWDHPDPRMDALHREVTSIVRGLAPGERQVVSARSRDVPRLTEPWFC